MSWFYWPNGNADRAGAIEWRLLNGVTPLDDWSNTGVVETDDATTGNYALEIDPTGATAIEWRDTTSGEESYSLESIVGDIAALSAAITALAATGTVNFNGPVSSDGTQVELVYGDDYADADDRALTFSSDSWPDLTAGSVVLILPGAGEIEGDILSATSCRFEIPNASTRLLAKPTKQTFTIRAELASGSIVTLLLNARLTVLGRNA